MVATVAMAGDMVVLVAMAALKVAAMEAAVMVATAVKALAEGAEVDLGGSSSTCTRRTRRLQLRSRPRCALLRSCPLDTMQDMAAMVGPEARVDEEVAGSHKTCMNRTDQQRWHSNPQSLRSRSCSLCTMQDTAATAMVLAQWC